MSNVPVPPASGQPTDEHKHQLWLPESSAPVPRAPAHLAASRARRARRSALWRQGDQVLHRFYTRASTGTRTIFATRPASGRSSRSCPPYLFKPEAPDRIKASHPELSSRRHAARPGGCDIFGLQDEHPLRVDAGSFDEVLKARPDLAGGNRYAFYLGEMVRDFRARKRARHALR